MRARTLIASTIVVIVCIAMAAPLYADTKFGDHEHQRDIPQLDFGLQSVESHVGGAPLLVQSGEKLVAVSPECVPQGAWVYVDLRVAWGERPGDELIVRMKGVEAAKLYRDRKRTEEWLRKNSPFARNIVLGETPFEVYIDTNGLTPGRFYPVELLGIRDDRRYTSKEHAFYLDVNPVEAYQQPVQTAPPVQSEQPRSSGQIDPMTLPVAAPGQTLVFGYLGCRGDQLVACIQYPTPVALVQVYRIEGQVAYASILRGAIPQDASVTLHRYTRGGRAR